MKRCQLLILLVTILSTLMFAQADCIPVVEHQILSPRLANYVIDIELDGPTHTVKGTEKITWTNASPEPVLELHLYMYLNAFSTRKSSYLSRGRWAEDLSEDSPENLGSVSIDKVYQGDAQLTDLRYIQPDDNNPHDKTVLSIPLAEPVPAGASVTLAFDFVSKLPRLLVRSGYANFDFNHFVHWYPKLGVYEQDKTGAWGWNCHQFLPRMEFYGDHGNYDVTILADDRFSIGGSGCRVAYRQDVSGSDKKKTQFIAHDVIDFGWVASPDLVEYEDQWEHVSIRLLSPKIHKNLVDRVMRAARESLAFMTEHVSPYPYNTLTILDPPLYALRSGFMEYPTYITGGSYFFFPEGIRSMESLIVHEFCHQYFMQMLANNEKEDPWLDEGFVTFYEDRVMEYAYGASSLADFCGYEVNNSAFTRNEYARLPNKASSHITNYSWEVEGDYKGIIYSKTATVLQTLMRYLGEEHFDEMMRTYFEKHKFTHPRRADFIEVVQVAFAKYPNPLSPFIDEFLTETLDGTNVCDYAINRVNGTRPDAEGEIKTFVTLERKGDLIVPVEVEVTWENGAKERTLWDGKEVYHQLTFTSKSQLCSVEIDPDRKLFLDIDFNNNSFTLQPAKGGILKYALRTIYWVQNTLQASSFLM